MEFNTSFHQSLHLGTHSNLEKPKRIRPYRNDEYTTRVSSLSNLHYAHDELLTFGYLSFYLPKVSD